MRAAGSVSDDAPQDSPDVAPVEGLPTLTVVHVHYLPSLGTPQVLGLEDLQARWKEADQLVTKRTAEVLDPLGVPWRFEVRTVSRRPN